MTVRAASFEPGDLVIVTDSLKRPLRTPDGRIFPLGTLLHVVSVSLKETLSNTVFASDQNHVGIYTYAFAECCEECRNGDGHHHLVNESGFLRKVDPKESEKEVNKILGITTSEEPKEKETVGYYTTLDMAKLMHEFARFWGCSLTDYKTVTVDKIKYSLAQSIMNMQVAPRQTVTYSDKVPMEAMQPLIALYEKTEKLFERARLVEELIIRESHDIEEFEKAN
jgi:hypothetical protein